MRKEIQLLIGRLYIGKISIKQKLVIVFIAAMLMLTVLNIIELLSEKNYIEKYDKLVEHLTTVASLYNQVDNIKEIIGILNATAGKDEKALAAYDENKKNMSLNLDNLEKNITFDKSKMELNRLNLVIKQCLERADETVSFATANDTLKAMSAYNECTKNAGFVKDASTDLATSESIYAKDLKEQILSSYTEKSVVFVILLILIIAVNLLFVFSITERIIKPLGKIVNKYLNLDYNR